MSINHSLQGCAGPGTSGPDVALRQEEPPWLGQGCWRPAGGTGDPGCRPFSCKCPQGFGANLRGGQPGPGQGAGQPAELAVLCLPWLPPPSPPTWRSLLLQAQPPPGHQVPRPPSPSSLTHSCGHHPRPRSPRTPHASPAPGFSPPHPGRKLPGPCPAPPSFHPAGPSSEPWEPPDGYPLPRALARLASSVPERGPLGQLAPRRCPSPCTSSKLRLRPERLRWPHARSLPGGTGGHSPVLAPRAQCVPLVDHQRCPVPLQPTSAPRGGPRLSLDRSSGGASVKQSLAWSQRPP